MTVHTPDGGEIPYRDMLTQSALADKRPSQVRNFAPVPKDRSWPNPAISVRLPSIGAG